MVGYARVRLLLITVLAAAVCLTCFSTYADPDRVTPLLKRLESDEVGDRINALRALARLAPDKSVIRPALAKMVEDPSMEVRTEVVWVVADVLGDQGVDILEQLFKDPQRSVRDGAIQATCRMWDRPKFRPMCQAAFDDPDFAARLSVLVTLKDFHPRDPAAAALFREGLKDSSQAVQRASVFGAQSARDKAAVPLLKKAAHTQPDFVAVPAAEEALATIASDEAIDALISLLTAPKDAKRPSHLVRAAAARAIARNKAAKAAPALRPLLEDPSVPVRVGVMEALMKIEDKQAVPAISEQLFDPEPRIRRVALRALHRIGDESCVAKVKKVLAEDKDPVVRTSAVLSLSGLMGEGAIPTLRSLKSDEELNVRLEAAGTLAGLGKPAAAALAEFLADPHSDIRTMAMRGLAQIGSEAQVPALIQALKSNKNVPTYERMEGANALGAISEKGNKQALALLGKMTTDSEPAVRERAAVGLGRIGGDKAKKQLLALSKDPVPRVRRAAKKAIDSIGKVN